jgi:CHAT domain-containing protein/tetratricopeptide (TPR) repeat protein
MSVYTRFTQFSGLITLGISLIPYCVLADSPVGLAGKGVVIEQIAPRTSLEIAGLQHGDVILSWERLPNPPANPDFVEGEITSPFDWIWMTREQSPRGTIRLEGHRGGQQISFTIGQASWMAEVRPVLSPPAEHLYLEGQRLLPTQPLEGIEIWEELARAAIANRELDLAAWLYGQICVAYIEANHSSKKASALANSQRSAQNSFIKAEIWKFLADRLDSKSHAEEAEKSYRAMLKFHTEFSQTSLAAAASQRFLGDFYHRNDRYEESLKTLMEIPKSVARQAPGSIMLASLFNQIGLAHHDLGNLEAALEYYTQSLDILARVASVSTTMADTLINIGIVESDLGDLESAHSFYERALGMYRLLRVEGPDLGALLLNMGSIPHMKGNLDEAAEYYEKSRAILESTQPDGLLHAYTLANLGLISHRKGNLLAAQRYYEQALKVEELIAPESISAAGSLMNLGTLLFDRGDLELAEDLYIRADAIARKAAPHGPVRTGVLLNLANIASARGELNLALSYHKRALELKRKGGDETSSIALSLEVIGQLLQRLERLPEAEAHLRKALKIREKIAPNSLDVAKSLDRLGELALVQRRSKAAEDLHNRALSIRRNLGDFGLDYAATLLNIGLVHINTGRQASGLEYLRLSYSIYEKLAPGTRSEANILHILAKIFIQQNRLETAAEHLQRAVEAVDNQTDRLGGPADIRAEFRAGYQEIYRDFIGTLLDLAKPKEAFQVLERYRGRNFLRIITERDLAINELSNNPAQVRLHEIATEYDRIQQELSRLLTPEQEKDVEPLLTRLRELSNERARVRTELRRGSPEYVSLRYPLPLDFFETRTLLTEELTMLSFFVRENEILLFALRAEQDLIVKRLNVTEQEMRDQVRLFLLLIREAATNPNQIERLRAMASRLYDETLGTVDNLIVGSKRLLIIPDGPLHLLPWGALIRQSPDDLDKPGQSWKYLAEWKPAHTAISATAYAELRRPSSLDQLADDLSLAAFGAPLYTPQSRGPSGKGLVFDPLPSSRLEVERIASLYAGSRVYVGANATEENAKSLPRRTRILHLAAHGVLDERFPLNSSIALSTPGLRGEGQDNGLFQAWEIFEETRLDADLVTLSACETALGRELGGEGLIGLTRAFQYAGARSVLASLWKISDRTTAELMVRFYKHLKEGMSKDEALRAAQIELIRGPIEITNEKGEVEKIDASAPYYWAAFQLYGDWQ